MLWFARESRAPPWQQVRETVDGEEDQVEGSRWVIGCNSSPKQVLLSKDAPWANKNWEPTGAKPAARAWPRHFFCPATALSPQFLLRYAINTVVCITILMIVTWESTWYGKMGQTCCDLSRSPSDRGKNTFVGIPIHFYIHFWLWNYKISFIMVKVSKMNSVTTSKASSRKITSLSMPYLSAKFDFYIRKTALTRDSWGVMFVGPLELREIILWAHINHRTRCRYCSILQNWIILRLLDNTHLGSTCVRYRYRSFKLVFHAALTCALYAIPTRVQNHVPSRRTVACWL